MIDSTGPEDDRFVFMQKTRDDGRPTMALPYPIKPVAAAPAPTDTAPGAPPPPRQQISTSSHPLLDGVPFVLSERCAILGKKKNLEEFIREAQQRLEAVELTLIRADLDFRLEKNVLSEAQSLHQ